MGRVSLDCWTPLSFKWDTFFFLPVEQTHLSSWASSTDITSDPDNTCLLTRCAFGFVRVYYWKTPRFLYIFFLCGGGWGWSGVPLLLLAVVLCLVLLLLYLTIYSFIFTFLCLFDYELSTVFCCCCCWCWCCCCCYYLDVYACKKYDIHTLKIV